jgi:hypothetical protein
MKVDRLKPNYLTQFPEQLAEGILYISEEFNLTAHKCCCGCQEDVVLKLGPAKWQLTKESDGAVSLNPSVGNWKYACRSHYWIENNQVFDAGPMSAGAIKRVQRRDRVERQQYLEQNASATDQKRQGMWMRITNAIQRGWRHVKGLWGD